MALKLLEGMKVIEIAAFMAAPMGGRILGEWGADVIKVEPPTGDSNRGIGLARHIYNGDQAGWDSINSCKRCITLDTRKPEGLAILKEMLKDCDVFLSHLRPKDSKKLGLDYESLSKINPKIICGNTSGYGTKGEWAPRGGFDAASYAARAGYDLDCPIKGDNPMIPYFGFGDIPTGTYLAMAVLAAYIEQQRTGKGQEVNVALMHAGMWSVGVPIVTAAYGDEYPTDPNSVLPLARPYMCSDEKAIALMGLQWHNSWLVRACLRHGRRPHRQVARLSDRAGRFCRDHADHHRGAGQRHARRGHREAHDHRYPVRPLPAFRRPAG